MDDDLIKPVGRAAATEDGLVKKAKAAAERAGVDIDVIAEKAGDYGAKAGHAAKDAASSGKDVAADALHALSDAARSVADKLTGESADYVRRAADGVDRFSDTLRDKSMDDLTRDARGAVRDHPAIAVGAAAVIGFALARFLRSGGSGDTRA